MKQNNRQSQQGVENIEILRTRNSCFQILELKEMDQTLLLSVLITKTKKLNPQEVEVHWCIGKEKLRKPY